MARKTREEAEQTRRRILDAALEVFFERGVAHPSLTDVAARIGMTRGAVYGHFRNKGEVLVALFDRERLPWEAFCADGVPAGRSDPLGALRLGLVGLLQQVCQRPSKARTLNILFYKIELAVQSEALVQRLEVARREAREHVRALLACAIEAGQLPPQRDPDQDARFLLMGVFGALTEWVWDPARFDLAAQADSLVDMWLGAIGANRA